MTRHIPDIDEQARYREYIMDSLEMAGSFEIQLAYQANVPIAQASAEVLLSWSDVFHADAPDYYTAPVFSDEELQAVREFHSVWLGVCARTPDPLPSLEELLPTVEWTLLRDAANRALEVFNIRGRSATP